MGNTARNTVVLVAFFALVASTLNGDVARVDAAIVEQAKPRAPQAGASVAVPAIAPVGFAPSDRPVGELVGRGVAVADFNGDGALDAFVVAQLTWQSCESRVYLGDGQGHSTDSGQRLVAARRSDQPLVFDIDGNDTMDIILGRATWVNDGRGRFTAGPAVLVDADGAPLRGGQLADLNGDGAVDLLWTVMSGQARTNAIRLYLNDRKGRFHEAGQTPLPGITPPSPLVISTPTPSPTSS